MLTMKNARDNLKKSRELSVPDESTERKQTPNITEMSIEEAREAEKVFNDELRIFREAAAINRKIVE